MTAKSQDPQDWQGREKTPPGYPAAFYREIQRFRPSAALEQMNALLSAIPVDLRKLGTALQDDPELAAEVVKFSNSSLFGLPRPVASLEQAVVATGSDMVRTLLLTCWLTRLSGNEIAPAENRFFWRHALSVAQISRRIAAWAGLPQPEQAFLAGLLHDIGDLPFLAALAKNGAEGRETIFEELGESLESQRRRFATDHCELGGRLAEVLAMPLPLAEVVAKHHQHGSAASGFPLLPIVAGSEVLAQALRPCRPQELRPEALGGFITDCLSKWLPELDRSASRHLVAELEAELLAGIAHTKSGAGDTWKRSITQPAARLEAVKSAVARG